MDMRQIYNSKVDAGIAEVSTYDDLKASIYLFESQKGGPVAVGFSGRRSKPDFNYRFRDDEQRQAHINKWLEGLKSRKEDKEKIQAERKAFKHDLKLGDIFYSSWGYDQTNIDFYQVVAVVSDKTVIVREVAQTREIREGYSSMSAYCMPVKNDFTGPEMKKTVGPYGIKVSDSHHASKWDGQAKYCSWYG